AFRGLALRSLRRAAAGGPPEGGPAPFIRRHAPGGQKGYPIRLRLLHSSTPMLFQHVAIAGLAHIDAPRRLSSAEINARLKPTLDRLGIKADVLGEVAGIHSRYLWEH